MQQDTRHHLPGRLGSARDLLAGLDPQTIAQLLTTPADVVLVLDAAGLILDVALGKDELVNLGCGDWQGKAWTDTVTTESRPKIEALIQKALAGGAAGPATAPRQVNHPLPTVQDLPVAYRVVPVQVPGHAELALVAFGHDLRADMALQQRLIGAQISMERDYWRLRHVETRYRLLFQQAAEPVLILDAATERIDEANPAAQNLFGDALRKSQWTLTDGIDPASVDTLREVYARLRANGRADTINVRLLRGGQEYRLAASVFRQENSTHFLIRLAPLNENAGPVPDDIPQLAELLMQAPDAFVVTDLDGRVIRVNRAFLELTQAASDEIARGELLDRWLGRSGVDLNVLVSNLRQHGSVRLFATQLRGEFGSVTDVEISAVAAMSARPPCLGFIIRDVGRRLPSDIAGRELPRSASQMTELVGRMPLKDIVRDTTDLIEQLCIEAALKLTGDNRASAAEMLGLSRQSLYVKLRRFGMSDGGADAAAESTEVPDPRDRG
jgi:transcriptional regulator PpsR